MGCYPSMFNRDTGFSGFSLCRAKYEGKGLRIKAKDTHVLSLAGWDGGNVFLPLIHYVPAGTHHAYHP